jgi:hypothetical protein
VPEPVPGALAGELEAVGAPSAAAELSTEVTCEAAELTVEAADVCVEVRGPSAAVAAWAGRENTSMIARIPAAASAACIATTAMRRANGCGISSSHSKGNGPPAYPSAAATNLALSGLAVRSSTYSVTTDRTRVHGSKSLSIRRAEAAGLDPPEVVARAMKHE